MNYLSKLPRFDNYKYDKTKSGDFAAYGYIFGCKNNPSNFDFHESFNSEVGALLSNSSRCIQLANNKITELDLYNYIKLPAIDDDFDTTLFSSTICLVFDIWVDTQEKITFDDDFSLLIMACQFYAEYQLTRKLNAITAPYYAIAAAIKAGILSNEADSIFNKYKKLNISSMTEVLDELTRTEDYFYIAKSNKLKSINESTRPKYVLLTLVDPKSY